MTTNQLATRKLITLFTGGGGFDEGAKMAGFTPVLGVEIVPDIAHWAEVNTPGLTVIRSDVAAVDYSQYETPYHLHASPSCKNASQANDDSEEAQEDLSAARGVCNALIALQPPCFSLENVYFYRTFQSFKLILRTLHELGYAFDYWHLNAADYGVPQSRKRLILIARKDRKPARPAATHTDPANLNGQMSLFGQQLKPWMGWLEAIQDIIHTLPDSEFAPWQLARLPKVDLPSGAFMPCYNNTADEREGFGIRVASEPSFTITSNSTLGKSKAFLVEGRNAGQQWSNGIKEAAAPAMTVTATHPPRAFIIPGDNTTNGVVRAANEPMVTVQSRSTGQCVHRAWLSQGRVVKMIPRALARFQSVPDSYLLPDDDKLACTIIGNMVPPLLAKAICESVKD